MTRKNKAGAAGGLPELKEPLAQASPPDPLLELREISYAYEGGQLALDGVSARFYPGKRWRCWAITARESPRFSSA